VLAEVVERQQGITVLKVIILFLAVLLLQVEEKELLTVIQQATLVVQEVVQVTQD
jgi:hypothetical protein